MNDDFLDEERAISEARESKEAKDILSLHKPIINLTELQRVVCVEPDTIVSDAVKLMAEKRVGCLLVTKGSTLVGLFTERDLLSKISAKGIDTAKTTVLEHMTPDPETLPADSPLVFALQRMSVGGYRHVPLMNKMNEPVAVVSMRDIVEHIVSIYQSEVLNLPDKPGNWSQRDGA